MPDWLAHLLVPICRDTGGRGQAAPTRPPDPAPNLRGHQAGQAWVASQAQHPRALGLEQPRTHLQPDDTLARLHGGIVKVPLLLLRVFDADVHTTLQPLCLGLGGERGWEYQGGAAGSPQPGPGCVSPGEAQVSGCNLPPAPAAQHLGLSSPVAPSLPSLGNGSPSLTAAQAKNFRGRHHLLSLSPSITSFYPAPATRPGHGHRLSPGRLSPTPPWSPHLTTHVAAAGGF